MRADGPELSRRSLIASAMAGAVALLVGCQEDGPSSEFSPSTSDSGASSAPTSEGGSSATAEPVDEGSRLFDSSVVHDIAVSFDTEAYDEMISTFVDRGEKTWIAADITIDGAAYKQIGMRLKGNSSLQGLRRGGGGGGGFGPGGAASADDPSSLPWLVRFDEFVDEQKHLGYDEIVIRSNSSETSLNEAVGLELVGLAGLATQQSFHSRVSVNGAAQALRLVVESPDGHWEDENFGDQGILYKAESGGDYSYRGDDPAAYEEIFDQETGDEDNLAPLIDFLDFINNSDDETFESDLDDHLDIDSFARYLAVQELIANSDDIDGPGNNSYLRYSSETGRFTVVNWDLNLAFGGFGQGDRTQPGGMPDPQDRQPPDGERGFPGGTGGGGADGGFPGGPGGRNILVERFRAVESFSSMYESALEDLRSSLYDSGAAADVLARRVAVLSTKATDVVSADTVQEEAATIEGFFV
jgi:spore coat protein CotH